LDKETGFYFYNARHYDPAISRFVTPDSVIDGQYDTQGWNRFSYTKNNSIIYKDPTGHAVAENSGTNMLSSVVNFFSGLFGGNSGGNNDTQNNIVAQKAQNAKDSIASRLSPIQKEMIDNYKTYTWKDEKGNIQTCHTTKIGGVNVDLAGRVTKEAIAGTSEKLLGNVNDMIKANKLDKITITDLKSARETGKYSPHQEGLGVDISEAWRDKEYVRFSSEKGKTETQLAKDITKYFMNEKKDSISQVLTPWQMKMGSNDKPHPNDWPIDPTADKGQAIIHKDHLHITGRK